MMIVLVSLNNIKRLNMPYKLTVQREINTVFNIRLVSETD